MKFLEFIKRINITKSTIIIGGLTLIVIIIAGFSYLTYTNVELKYNNSQSSIKLLNGNLVSLKNQVNSVNTQLVNLQNTDLGKQNTSLQSQLDNITNAFNTYSSLQTQVTKSKGLGINVDAFNTQLTAISNFIFEQQFTNAISAENTLNTQIVNAQNQLAASQKKTVTQTTTSGSSTPTTLPGSSFNITTVNAQGTNYSVYYISIDLTSPNLKIITDTANSSDCLNNCPVNDLMAYYNNDHGFAAINGTYLCPATYSTCVGSVNSFNFPVYNSILGKWINQADIVWTGRSMLTFSSNNTPTFYADASTYSGQAIRAGFVMAPGLVQNGQVLTGNFVGLDTKSATVEEARGAIGIKGNTLIIADALSATVPQMGYIMQAMGVSDAINIDGGGSTAMIYNGQYRLGPGRQIPNVIVFSDN